MSFWRAFPDLGVPCAYWGVSFPPTQQRRLCQPTCWEGTPRSSRNLQSTTFKHISHHANGLSFKVETKLSAMLSSTHSGEACYGDCLKLRPSIRLSSQW